MALVLLSGKCSSILFGTNWACQTVLVTGGKVRCGEAWQEQIGSTGGYGAHDGASHKTNESDRIILAIKAGRFHTDKEYEEIKL